MEVAAEFNFLDREIEKVRVIVDGDCYYRSMGIAEDG